MNGPLASAQTQCDLPKGGIVGVFADEAATESTIRLPVPEGGSSMRTMFVVARITGAAVDGIKSVEFRIEVTNPSNWLIAAIFDADIVQGTVVDVGDGNGGGVQLVWLECQQGSGPAQDLIVLGTLHVFHFGETPGETDLLVRRVEPPVSPNRLCASFFLCDAPTFTASPMTVLEPGISKPETSNDDIVFRSTLICCDPSVAVKDETLSSVKSLYRVDD